MDRVEKVWPRNVVHGSWLAFYGGMVVEDGQSRKSVAKECCT